MAQIKDNVKEPDILYTKHLNDVKKEVLKGYKQAVTGKTKDFDNVCNRLVEKYRSLNV